MARARGTGLISSAMKKGQISHLAFYAQTLLLHTFQRVERQRKSRRWMLSGGLA
jgi:hypothetical protein